MKSILIIEDAANIRLFVRANLEVRGYKVLEAETGADGLGLLQEMRPSLVLLDMLLPDIQGWELLQIMSEDSVLRNIPVILMTALIPTPETENISYPNLLAWLTKPMSVDVLIQTIEKAINKS